MTIDHRVGSKLDVADISIVTARVIEGEWFHRLGVEDTVKGQLDSLFWVPRYLRSFHCRVPIVNSALQQIAPGPAFSGRAAWLLLREFPKVCARLEMRAGDPDIPHCHAR